MRDPGKAAALPVHDRLVVVEGDLLDDTSVNKVVDGVDAVVHVAGPVKGSPEDLQRRAITVVLEAMAERGGEPLISLKGGGRAGRG